MTQNRKSFEWNSMYTRRMVPNWKKGGTRVGGSYLAGVWKSKGGVLVEQTLSTLKLRNL